MDIIAKTILLQLGGNHFIVMTGSNNFVSLSHGLRMNLAMNKSSANRLSITLDESKDTYVMHFYRQTMNKFGEIKMCDVAKYEDVYFDMLQPLFTKVTGMYTHL